MLYDSQLLPKLQLHYQLNNSIIQTLTQYPTILIVLQDIKSYWPVDLQPSRSIIEQLCDLNQKLNERNLTFSQDAIQTCFASIPARQILKHYVEQNLWLPSDVNQLLKSGCLKFLYELVNQHKTLLEFQARSNTHSNIHFFRQDNEQNTKNLRLSLIFQEHFQREDQFELHVLQETISKIRELQTPNAVIQLRLSHR